MSVAANPLTGSGQVLVLGQGVTALGTIRSLHQAGFPVIHLIPAGGDGFASRFVSRRLVVPNPVSEPDALRRALLALPQELDGAVLLPTTDPAVELVARHRPELARRFVPTTPEIDVVRQLLDKHNLYELAAALGVTLPRIITAGTTELRGQIAGLEYPCLLKPFQTTAFFARYGCKVAIVHGPDELLRRHAEISAQGIDVMVCEIVPGPDSNLYGYVVYLNERGEVLAELCRQKVRQHPAGFGQACVIKTVPMVAEVRDMALTLLRHCGYRGFTSVEFKRHAQNGRFYLIEANIRPPISTTLATSAGINFPQITCLDRLGLPVPPCTRYREEVYWIHNLHEPWTLAHHLRNERGGLREFFHPYRQTRVYGVPFRDDPRPFLVLAGRIFGSSLLARLTARQRR